MSLASEQEKEKNESLDDLLERAYNQNIPLWKVLLPNDEHTTIIEQILSYQDGQYKLVKRLLSDDTCDVNACGKYRPPLLRCVHHAKDNEGSADYKYVRIMELILQHPKCDVNVRDNMLNQTALHRICQNARSASGACLLIEHKDIDLCKVDNQGNTALHLLINRVGRTNINTITAILRPFLNNPNISKAMNIPDRLGLNVDDRFLSNQMVHAYDLDIQESVQNILRMLLSVKIWTTTPGKTLAVAGTLCPPTVFKMLLESGASTSDSLEGETSLHCVISRNSVEKCKSILDRDPDLNLRWNYCDALELAQTCGCKKEIIRMLNAKKRELSPNNVVPIDRRIQCDENVNNTTSLSLEWSKFETFTSSKIRIGHETQGNTSPKHKDSFAVKYSDFIMREHCKEIKNIQKAVRAMFDDISKQFANSPACSHMTYKYVLSGSLRDNCKVFGPTEMDAVLEVDSQSDDLTLFTGTTEVMIRVKTQSKWRAYGQKGNLMCVVRTAQSFYNKFACETYRYSAKIRKSSLGIVKVVFQFLSKISRLRVTWKGNAFKELIFYIDVVVAFPIKDTQEKFPMGVKCSSFHAIAKGDRHGFSESVAFPISKCEAETIVMQALPEPIRQAFITAKAVRLSSVCAPGFDLNHFQIVEDLAIEEYISSHALKNCVLNILKGLGTNEISKLESLNLNKLDMGLSGSDIKQTCNVNFCKYILADSIYAQFQSDLNNKVMHAWHGDDIYLFDCRKEKYHKDYWVCCRKRQIKLALVTQIRQWLNDVDKLRALHDGDECTCTYTLAEMEYHWEFIDHLKNGRSPFEHMNTDARAFQQKFCNKLITSPI